MLLSELAGKELINVSTGERLGEVGHSDLVVDNTGKIKSIILPQKGNLLNFWGEKEEIIIPWQAVKKVGNEVIIVELDETVPQFKRYREYID